MAGLIIIKYASMPRDTNSITEEDSIVGSYSAKECGVKQVLYSSVEEAQPDLKKLRDFNPTVDYGLVLII